MARIALAAALPTNCLFFFILVVGTHVLAWSREGEFWSRLGQPPSVRSREFANRLCRVQNRLESGVVVSHPPNSYALLEGQQCDCPFPGLETRPFPDSNLLPWATNDLERDWTVVNDELDGYLVRQQQQQQQQDGSELWKTSSTMLCKDTTGFAKLVLIDETGTPTSVGSDAFPETVRLLKSVVGVHLAPRPVCINRQAARSGLAPHSDNMNFVWTCHLGLRVPREGCQFCMHTDRNDPTAVTMHKSWQPGELLVADTSFVHSTRNPSVHDDRFVLAFCVWHPQLSPEERCYIREMHQSLSDLS